MTPFTVPNLPTDNLYKFYALSGVIATIFILITMSYVTFNIRNDVDEIGKASDLITLESDFLEDGATEFTEIGPGNFLRGLVRQIDKNVNTYGIS